ncbi:MULTISPECIES: 23S rRNA (adenine(2030)-N(6))-methyltransferase RlmJ [unclassified Mesorhizobium]|uniref:23S rRNA (adenine(2030)-N(6))-methyltransferase RlmJ n=1 Tax=unclassified Mesorhizobium TaxID=325217 RepID=UPI00112D8B94|nr:MULTISPECIES: 23S rRNA (adenine(2030)-N(6))-methyltransferase RlmJ [unclassified Mesorhizobium]TPI56601.1 23S rRNA (adenine(2030)-N(6))-methyltransferase RlmJ [Mesorhizobium sp. B3-1-1]TPJ59625.1 23S rRNA (adenine(2030)-N(6))-methyltransferase RlmJ [Mesorhizobium sp. B2-6-7]TPJ88851.1 23S rRNA (adenine(2030)-N(6))-methyltransferase RlmJ [Mesorhizobium sp. B2-6-3]TPK03932.1 23S rRNA (adenine(2030)-N(6))-methyltransferase RlmJ [Mesorhizobium sp. B2-5-10]TPK14371.1 23S rRNA (adenine(2030)-N(6)
MNYRHAYHAGNFADVLKHVVLTRLLEYLKQKDKAFRVIDTHAGIGRYDLSSPEAQKTGEWQGGIGRLVDAAPEAQAAMLLAPYLDAVRACNADGQLKKYPGSPLVARHLLRKQDRLSAIELHPKDVAKLKTEFAGDFQTRVIELDGWLALGAHLPPKEKRGLVLIDPPFEEEGEFGRLVDGLAKAHKRWPGGIYALWYPIKDRKAVIGFRKALKETGVPKLLDIEFEIRPASQAPSLDGSGLVVANPPFTLEGELRILLPALHKLLVLEKPAHWTLNWLAGE